MFNIPDHPVIRAIERTGYPFPVEDVIGYCEYCGKPIYEYDTFLTKGCCDPQYICAECAEYEEEEDE